MSAFSLFLTLDGVNGESTAQGHEGAIDLDTWAFGLSSSANAGGGGGGVGRALWDQIILTMPTTAALPQLMALCASARVVHRGVLTAQSGHGEAPFVWLRLTLGDVRVAHVASGASAPGDSSEDQVGLAFGTILVEKFSQAPDGSVGDPVAFGWDVRTNRRTKQLTPKEPKEPKEPKAATGGKAKAVKKVKAAKPAQDAVAAAPAPAQ